MVPLSILALVSETRFRCFGKKFDPTRAQHGQTHTNFPLILCFVSKLWSDLPSWAIFSINLPTLLNVTQPIALRFTTSKKSKIPVNQKCGIYQISCGQCSSISISQMGRGLKERYEEHHSAFLKIQPLLIVQMSTISVSQRSPSSILLLKVDL